MQTFSSANMPINTEARNTQPSVYKPSVYKYAAKLTCKHLGRAALPHASKRYVYSYYYVSSYYNMCPHSNIYDRCEKDASD